MVAKELPYYLIQKKFFPGYDGYLNLGGIANLNMPKLGLAFDIALATKS